MAKSQREKINAILTEREVLIHVSKLHGACYVPAIVCTLIGAFITFSNVIPMDFLEAMPEQLAFLSGEAIKNLREHYYGLVMFGGGIFVFIQTYFKKLNLLQLITSKRIIEHSGFIISKEKEVYLHRIKSIKIKHTIIDRLLHRGKIIIKGKEKSENMELNSVVDPLIFSEKIHMAQERYGRMLTKKDMKGKKRKY